MATDASSSNIGSGDSSASLPQHMKLPSAKSGPEGTSPRPRRSSMKTKRHRSSDGRGKKTAESAAAAASKTVSFCCCCCEPEAVAAASTAQEEPPVKTDIHEIERWQDMSEQERALVWFSRRDFDTIKQSYRDIIARMRNKELLQDTDDVSTRGLECRSVAGSKRRRDAQINGLMAVLGEQDRQRKANIVEPETLAAVYRQYSYHCQQAATNMGRRDEYAVSDYVQALPRELQVGMSDTLRLRLSLPSAPLPGRRSLGLGGPTRFPVRNGRISSLASRSTGNRTGVAAAAARRRAAAA